MQTTPSTNAQRVAKSRRASIASGRTRAPDGILSDDASIALAALLSADYAKSAIGVVNAALIDAQKKMIRAAK